MGPKTCSGIGTLFVLKRFRATNFQTALSAPPPFSPSCPVSHQVIYQNRRLRLFHFEGFYLVQMRHYSNCWLAPIADSWCVSREMVSKLTHKANSHLSPSPTASCRTSLGLTDYSQIHSLGAWYKSVNFGARKSQGEANWYAQID